MSAGMHAAGRIIAHGWWLMGGAKMSKSIGNVARYQDYVAVFGVDALRYFVMREMPLGQDANFSDDAILARFNADLANDLGNVVSRTTTMIARYCEGVVPGSPRDARRSGPRARADIDTAIEAAQANFGSFQITLALQATWDLIRSREPVHRPARAVDAGKEAASAAEAGCDAVSRADALRVTPR